MTYRRLRGILALFGLAGINFFILASICFLCSMLLLIGFVKPHENPECHINSPLYRKIMEQQDVWIEMFPDLNGRSDTIYVDIGKRYEQKIVGHYVPFEQELRGLWIPTLIGINDDWRGNYGLYLAINGIVPDSEKYYFDPLDNDIYCFGLQSNIGAREVWEQEYCWFLKFTGDCKTENE